MFFTPLETERLCLRNLSMDDRAFMLAQFSNDEVNRYLFDAEPTRCLEDADEIIRFYVEPEPRGQHRWVLVRKADGARLGTCGFHRWSPEAGECEVGYDLYPDFWGNGYMREAMQAILAFARERMRVRAVHACIAVGNERSLRLAESLGFAFSGEMYDEVFRGERYPHKILTLDLPAAE